MLVLDTTAMSFYDALKAVRSGKRVTKLEWGNPMVFLCLYQGQLCLHKDDLLYHPLIISEQDLDGNDYVLSATALPQEKFRHN